MQILSEHPGVDVEQPQDFVNRLFARITLYDQVRKRRKYGELPFIALLALCSLFLLCFFAYLAQAVYRAWRAGILEDEWALFALGFFIYWLFINNFESYLSFNSGVFTFGLVAGGLLTRVLNGSAGHASGEPVRASAAVTAAG